MSGRRHAASLLRVAAGAPLRKGLVQVGTRRTQARVVDAERGAQIASNGFDAS